MFDVNEIRKDFPMIQNNQDVVYFDNGATTFKPKAVIDAVSHFYEYGTSNVHRGDYPLSMEADGLYDEVRSIIAEFINCKPNEVVYTSGATMGLNQVAYGLMHSYLQKGDTVLITLAEHAANVLPWFRLKEEYGINVKYIPVDKQGRIHIEDVEECFDETVKVVSIAQVTNVLGSLQPVKEIAKIAHKHGALMVVDGAQSVPHMKVDVKDLDCDFLVFSAHKMCGPSGVGVLYGKYDQLEKMDPIFLGGGMNARFQSACTMQLKNAPVKFEAGTPNIEGVIGMGAAANYLMEIGMDEIHAYELELRKYFLEKISQLDNVELYNPDNVTGPITFNGKGVFAQDGAAYLASKGVAVRSGNHCAKILHEVIGTDGTIRAALNFYNTKEEVDRFIEAAKGISVENAIGIFF